MLPRSVPVRAWRRVETRPTIGENDPPPTKTYTQAELDAAVSGLKSKNTELLGKVVKFKDLPEDATPDDYEREIDRLDAATRAR